MHCPSACHFHSNFYADSWKYRVVNKPKSPTWLLCKAVSQDVKDWIRLAACRKLLPLLYMLLGSRQTKQSSFQGCEASSKFTLSFFFFLIASKKQRKTKHSHFKLHQKQSEKNQCLTNRKGQILGKEMLPSFQKGMLFFFFLTDNHQQAVRCLSNTHALQCQELLKYIGSPSLKQMGQRSNQ